MDINPEVRERILAAAQSLFEQSGRVELPTVDAVRRLSKTNMNDASAVMKEWRRLQIVSAAAVAVSVPEKVSQASQAALSALWSEAQELANESLNVAQAAWDAERAEAEKLRVELSSAFETQGAELDALRVRLVEVEAAASAAARASEVAAEEARRQVMALTDTAHTAVARAQEIEKRAEDLKAAVTVAQAAVVAVTAELEAERKQHVTTRGRVESLGLEIATVKARAEAQGQLQSENAERLKRVEAELAQARAGEGNAREEAAKLKGQAEALTVQHAELMQVLKDREGERPAPRGKK
jgi:colicin import membrane protein